MANDYRCVVEVMKWSYAKLALEGGALCCSSWLKACESKELWHSYLDDTNDESMPHSDPKLAFRDLYLHSAHKLLPLVVESRYAGLFNCARRSFDRLPSSRQVAIERFSAAAMISVTELFVCGGEIRSNDAFLLKLNRGTIKSLRQMKVARTCHSVVADGRVVYVFGGGKVNNPLQSSEKYDVDAQKWHLLPSMQTPRSAFNACKQGKTIYLCGGNTHLCEKFSLDSETFAPLPFHLKEASWTVAFIHKEELVVVIGSTFYFPMREHDCEREALPGFYAYAAHRRTRHVPVVWGSKVYWSTFSLGVIYEVDLRTFHATTIGVA